MANEDMLIGTQVVVDLDNGAALGSVVAAAQRAWGFNFVAPSIHHFHSTSRNASVVMWMGWSRHAGVHNSNQPFQCRANHIPIHRRCPDCLNPDVVMNQESTRPMWRHKRTPNPLSSIPQKLQSL